MKSKTHQINGFIDAILFAGFVLACLLDLTGKESHQWLGMATGGLALYHLWRHRAWVQAATRRWLTGLSGQARLYALLDLGLLAGMGGIIFTGVVISSWLNLPLASYAAWHDWHVGITLVTLGLLVAKLGLHWRWIALTMRGWTPSRPPAASPAPSPAAAPAGALSRRDFLQVMGVVSIAALLITARVVNAPAAAATPEQQPASTTAAGNTNTADSTATAQSTSNSAAASCQVRCNRRCSYPGHCRRYTDANRNGRCDWGECS